MFYFFILKRILFSVNFCDKILIEDSVNCSTLGYPPVVWQSRIKTINFPEGVNWTVPGKTKDVIIGFKLFFSGSTS